MYLKKKIFRSIARALLFPGFIFICLHLSACSQVSKEQLYSQYTRLCEIIGVNYSKFENTKRTRGDLVRLYTLLGKDINNNISDARIRKTFFMLFNIGAKNPYEIFREDVKKRTGREYHCDAFVSLTKIQVQSE